jgi:regulator of replication initiation timing
MFKRIKELEATVEELYIKVGTLDDALKDVEETIFRLEATKAFKGDGRKKPWTKARRKQQSEAIKRYWASKKENK